jgi:hypothetical protein
VHGLELTTCTRRAWKIWTRTKRWSSVRYLKPYVLAIEGLAVSSSSVVPSSWAPVLRVGGAANLFIELSRVEMLIPLSSDAVFRFTQMVATTNKKTS